MINDWVVYILIALAIYALGCAVLAIGKALAKQHDPEQDDAEQMAYLSEWRREHE